MVQPFTEKEKVIVSDIETDPLWQDHKDLALKFGLRACWSFPILDAKEDVLAAFAVYYNTAKTPTPVELDTIERAANLVTIIIESKRAEEELSISNERYTLATKATNDAIWDLISIQGCIFGAKASITSLATNPAPKVRTRRFWEMHVHPEDRVQVLKNMEKFIRRKDKDLWLEEYRFKKSRWEVCTGIRPGPSSSLEKKEK